MAVDEIEESLRSGTSWPSEWLMGSHQEGCTEPWIAEILCALMKANRSLVVLETGGFLGTTSAWLALALKEMGEGKLYIAEIDAERRSAILDRLHRVGADPEQYQMLPGDVLAYLQQFGDRSIDFVFVDDDHHPVHVEQEINALWPKMKPGGIICFHDVVGSTAAIGALVKKYGGIVLDLPRLGPAGGLGILTIPK